MKFTAVVIAVLLLIVGINAAALAVKSSAKPHSASQTKNSVTSKNTQSQIRRRDLSFFNTHSFYQPLSIHHNAFPLEVPLAAPTPFLPLRAPLAPLPYSHPGPLAPAPLPLSLFPSNSLNETIKKLEADLKSLQEIQKQTEISLTNLKNINNTNPSFAGKIGDNQAVNFAPSTPDKVNLTNTLLLKGLPSLTNANAYDPIFGPEIGQRYEIHYNVPEHFKFNHIPPLPFFGPGLAPISPPLFDSSFGVAAPFPSFPQSPVKPVAEPTTTEGIPTPTGNGNFDPTATGNGNGPAPDSNNGNITPATPNDNGAKTENFGENNGVGIPTSVDGAQPNESSQDSAGSAEQVPGSQASGPAPEQTASFVAGSQSGAPVPGYTRAFVGNSQLGNRALNLRTGAGYQSVPKPTH